MARLAAVLTHKRARLTALFQLHTPRSTSLQILVTIPFNDQCLNISATTVMAFNNLKTIQTDGVCRLVDGVTHAIQCAGILEPLSHVVICETARIDAQLRNRGVDSVAAGGLRPVDSQVSYSRTGTAVHSTMRTSSPPIEISG